MHHLAVKSNVVDRGHESRLCSSPPLCPKPRRLGGSAVPEFIKTLGYSTINHRSQLNSDGRSGILNMIISENTREEGGGGTICSSGCSESCYSGSPPGRTSNPLVHDVQFIHQMEQQYSPFSRPKLPEKFGFASVSPA